MDVYSLLEKYKLYDSVDIIEFYEKHYNFKQNIFTSSDDIKINYIARKYVQTKIPSYDYFYYLENNIRGYSTERLINGKYFQQAAVSYKDGYYNEKVYDISFNNNKEEYFNRENSFEIINSIFREIE